MTLDIEKIKAAAMAATPGEWMRLFGERTVYDRMEDGCRGNAIVRADTCFTEQDTKNLDFIALANPQTVHELITRLEAAEKDAAKYQELIYAVGRKFPDETRHETALKYIRQMEEPSKNAAMKESEK